MVIYIILEIKMSVHRICKFDPKKSKNKMAIFNLFENVTTFYTNIFWYVQPLRSFFLQKDTQKDFYSDGNRTDGAAQIVV